MCTYNGSNVGESCTAWKVECIYVLKNKYEVLVDPRVRHLHQEGKIKCWVI